MPTTPLHRLHACKKDLAEMARWVLMQGCALHDGMGRVEITTLFLGGSAEAQLFIPPPIGI
jgi:hypothetical protein